MFAAESDPGLPPQGALPPQRPAAVAWSPTHNDCWARDSGHRAPVASLPVPAPAPVALIFADPEREGAAELGRAGPALQPSLPAPRAPISMFLFSDSDSEGAAELGRAEPALQARPSAPAPAPPAGPAPTASQQRTAPARLALATRRAAAQAAATELEASARGPGGRPSIVEQWPTDEMRAAAAAVLGGSAASTSRETARLFNVDRKWLPRLLIVAADLAMEVEVRHFVALLHGVEAASADGRLKPARFSCSRMYVRCSDDVVVCFVFAFELWR